MHLSNKVHLLLEKSQDLVRRKTFQFTTGGIFIFLVVLGFTNPKREHYIDYASERIHEASKQNCSDLDQKIGIAFFSLPTGDLCKSVVGSAGFLGGRGLTKKIIDLSTKESQNYVIFSIYTTKILGIGKEYKTIGVLGRFFTYSSK